MIFGLWTFYVILYFLYHVGNIMMYYMCTNYSNSGLHGYTVVCMVDVVVVAMHNMCITMKHSSWNCTIVR